MCRLRAAVVLVSCLVFPISALSQAQPQNDTQSVQNHVISVSRGGVAYGKPDLGIMVMSLRSTSAIADEAVSDNSQKAKDVESALTALGYTSENYKISSVTFGHGGGGPMFNPNRSEITAYEASQYVYIFFDAADLSDMAKLTDKTAKVIEALRKAGAVPGDEMNMRNPMMPNALIIYTLKDSEPYERQALQQAISRARNAAQDIAKGMGVELAGLRSIKSGYLGGNYMPRSGNTALEGLSYTFYSTKSDEVAIHANATIEYDFK